MAKELSNRRKKHAHVITELTSARAIDTFSDDVVETFRRVVARVAEELGPGRAARPPAPPASRPPATLTWWLDHKRIDGGKQDSFFSFYI